MKFSQSYIGYDLQLKKRGKERLKENHTVYSALWKNNFGS